MPQLDLVRDLRATPWPELLDWQARGLLIDALGEWTALAIGVLPGGMADGGPSVVFKVALAEGTGVLVFDTSLKLLLAAADALRAAYPDADRDPPRREALR